MGFTTSKYGHSSEGFVSWLGRAILGRSSKFKTDRYFWNFFGAKEFVLDCSFGELYNVAVNVPHLNTVISRGAEMFSEMQIKHLNKAGEEIENSEYVKLFKRPNPLQTQAGWLRDYYIQNAIYSTGLCYENKPLRSSKLPSALWWLPAGYVEIKTTGKMFDQTDVSGIIEQYKMQVSDRIFKPEEIVHIITGISEDKIVGHSRIVSLQVPLSNITAALKSNNIILTKRGMIGFISGDSKNSNGMGPQLTPDERTGLENTYQDRYDLDSKDGHVMVTEATLKWNPVVFDVKQLMLFEGIEDSFSQICAAYGHQRDLYPSVKGATFENQDMALKTTIQNTMQPLGNSMLEPFALRWGLLDKGESLVASWEHMPVMQENKQEAAQALQTNVSAYSTMLKDGVISHKQYAELAGVKLDGTQETMEQTLSKQNNDSTDKQKGKGN